MNLKVQNKCILSKWLFRLTNEDDIWQQILRNKYLKSKTLTQVEKKPGDSQFWSGLMSVKQEFLNWMMFKVQNGKQTRFWEDKWLGNSALKDQYPNLFNLVHRKHVTVYTVLNGDSLNVSFRRHLTGNNLMDWMDLGHRVANIQLEDNKDIEIWQLHKSG